ncbi:NADH-quinone oxidoreductase subunit I [bacterium]|nr:NADH-quinone oxidoreductase subunit I [bacterium]
MQKPDNADNRELHDEHQKGRASLGREVFDRLDPSSAHEDVLPSKRGQIAAILILIALFWTVIVSGLVFYEQILDVEAHERGLGLIILTLPPILFIAIAAVAVFWYLAGRFTTWNSWGRENPNVARWFWMLALICASIVYLDPLNRIHYLLSNFPLIGKMNAGVFLIALLLAALFVALLFDNFIFCVRRGWFWVSRWHDQFVSILLGMKITGVHLLRPPTTELYPEEKPDLAPIFRGRHMLAFDEKGDHLCIACKACERICPDRLIIIESVRNPETKKQVLTGFLLDNSRCSFCGLCEDVCPTSAIKHTPEFAYSAFCRDDLVIDIFGEYLEKVKMLGKSTGEEM